MLWVGCSQELRNSQAVAEACQKLSTDLPSSTVSEDQWPASISELHPQAVKVDHGTVWIFTAQETTHPAEGYIYIPTGQPLPTQSIFKFSSTPTPGLYSFAQIP